MERDTRIIVWENLCSLSMPVVLCAQMLCKWGKERERVGVCEWVSMLLKVCKMDTKSNNFSNYQAH